MTPQERRIKFIEWYDKKNGQNFYTRTDDGFKCESEVNQLAHSQIKGVQESFFEITDSNIVSELIDCIKNGKLQTKKGTKAKGGTLPLVRSYLNSYGDFLSIIVDFDESKVPLNLILYGPPGTGKTYHTIEKAVDIIDGVDSGRKHDAAKELFDKYKEEGRIVFTTFHQSMSYEDFIEGIKPELGFGSLGYKIENGIFKQISNAAKETNEKYVLIIDEINRGNVANIFGELITLIEEDKRLGNSEEMTCKLPYSKGEFGVPNNLYIIGTMNTADRSVEALDTALRRRFTFGEMMPKPELLKEKETDVGINLTGFLNVINKRISLLKDREHQIGHSYFMNVDSKEALIDVIFKNVIPLLQEYFYGDYEKIQMVLGDKFIHREKPRTDEFAIKDGNFDNPEYIYSIVKQEEITADIDAALESINFGFSKPA